MAVCQLEFLSLIFFKFGPRLLSCSPLFCVSARLSSFLT